TRRRTGRRTGHWRRPAGAVTFHGVRALCMVSRDRGGAGGPCTGGGPARQPPAPATRRPAGRLRGAGAGAGEPRRPPGGGGPPRPPPGPLHTNRSVCSHRAVTAVPSRSFTVFHGGRPDADVQRSR